MRISGLVWMAIMTIGTAGVTYAAFRPGGITERVRAVSDQATCHTLDNAAAAYLALNDEPPAGIDDLKAYVSGDLTRYRIVDGLPAGPGCPA